jgi:hypothetical protein
MTPKDWKDVKAIFRTSDEKSERKIMIDQNSINESPSNALRDLIIHTRKDEGFSL